MKSVYITVLTLVLLALFYFACSDAFAQGKPHPLADPSATDDFHPLSAQAQQAQQAAENNSLKVADVEYLTCEYTLISSRSFYNGDLWRGVSYCSANNGGQFQGSLNSILPKYNIISLESTDKRVRFLLHRK